MIVKTLEICENVKGLNDVNKRDKNKTKTNNNPSFLENDFGFCPHSKNFYSLFGIVQPWLISNIQIQGETLFFRVRFYSSGVIDQNNP